MKRTVTPEQQQAARERREKFYKLAKSIADMTEEQRLALSAKLPVIATVEGRALSLHNQILIASQCPTATLVGGFRQWIAAGRAVKKGEHGFMIWIPRIPKQDDSGLIAEGGDVRFLIGTVFDVSQTVEIETQAAA